MSLNSMLSGAFEEIKEHSGTIFSGIAVMGVFSTAYFSGKAAVEVDHELDPDMSATEKMELYIKAYWKTGLSAAVTSACIIGSDRIHVGKELGLAGVAAIWKNREMAQNKKLVEEVGPERAKEIIKESVEKEDDIPKPKRYSGKVPEASMASKLYVYEPYSGQHFYTTRETIAWVMLEANRMLAQSGRVKLNAIVTMLGGESREEISDLGWFWDDENQNDDWMHSCGPWIEIYPDVYEHCGRDALCLFYTIEPQRDAFCNKLYREET